jgi:hypothetical protein
LKLHFMKPSEPQRSRSQFRMRNAPKLPTQNIAAKRRAGQEGVDSDYLFGKFLRLPGFRSTSDHPFLALIFHRFVFTACAQKAKSR